MFSRTIIETATHYKRCPLALAVVLTLSMAMAAACIKPLAVDEERYYEARTMPESQAKKTISKFASPDWAERPYLTAQVNYQKKPHLHTDRIEYNVRIPVPFGDMVISRGIGRADCITVSRYQDQVYDSKRLTMTYYQMKTICCNQKLEKDALVDALIRMGCRLN